MSTTFSFGMFSFEGNETVTALANYLSNIASVTVISKDAISRLVVNELENLRNINTEKFGEATDTAVREAVYVYVSEGLVPSVVVPEDYSFIKLGDDGTYHGYRNSILNEVD